MALLPALRQRAAVPTWRSQLAFPPPESERAGVGWGGAGAAEAGQSALLLETGLPGSPFCVHTDFLWSQFGFSWKLYFCIFPSCFSGNIKNKHTHSCVTWLPATFFQQAPRAGNSARLGLQKSKLTLT